MVFDQKKYFEEYYKENKEKLKKYHKEWREKNRKKLRERYHKLKDKQNEYKRNNRDLMNKQQSEWRKNNPEKQKEYRKKYCKSINARNITNRKIKIQKGQICEDCKMELATQRHHEDYDKPLEVKFLCRKCHNKIHGGNWKNGI